MSNKESLILFDFCETLVNLQTADGFIRYCILKEGHKRKALYFKFVKSRFFSILSKLRIVGNSKLILLKLLQGFSRDKIQKYANEYTIYLIDNKLNDYVFDLFMKHVESGDKIVIISGGYSIYLNEFYSDRLDCVISSEIKFNEKGICTGTLDGLDCLYLNKITLLKKQFGDDVFDKYKTTFYTDHSSDLPLLEKVDKGYVIKTEKNQDWAITKGYEILNAKYQIDH